MVFTSSRYDVMVLLGPGDAQKLHGAFHHAHGRIAIAAHDTIAERTVVGSYPHGSAILLADANERCKALPDPLDLLYIIRIRILYELKFLLVNIITRIHAHLLNDPCGDLRSIGRKMYISH
jgi:hypothetical protein